MSRISRKAVPATAEAARTSSVRNPGKITAPTLRRVFGNERLFARLDAARFYPIVWVHGPPGAGKTTLAASYLAAKGVAPLWCRLDEGDADPASVFLHLAEAAKLRAPKLELPLLQPEFRTALPLFARRFFRDLFATDGVSVMVLDDYHEVAAGAELHDCLPAGLEEVPAGCQVMVISRSPPPSHLARLRLNGRIDVIEPCALRLNPKEIRALAKERGTDTPHLAEERIVGATQGWAAGVILMLEAATAGHAETHPEAPLPELLFDYFAGEVLQRMEPWAPAVLSTLALLPTMTAATAGRLTSRPEAGALLEDLHRRNYFTTCDSAPEPRYRFHPLFRDFLRSAARRHGTHKDETLLKIRAAAVLDEDGQPDAAVPLLVETGQTEALAALVKRRAHALVEDGRSDTLIGWLSHFSDEEIAADAWLSYWRGAARVGVDPIGSYAHLERALALFEATDDALGHYQAWIGLAEAIRFDVFGDMARFDFLIAMVPALRARHPDFPSPSIELRFSMSMAMALWRRSSDRPEVFRWETRARTLATQVGTPALTLRMGFTFAIMDLMDGRFDSAARALANLPDPLTLDHLPLAQWAGLVTKGLRLAYRQEAGDGRAFTNEAIKRLEQSGIVMWTPMLAAYRGMSAWINGDATEAAEWCARIATYSDRAGIERGPIFYSVTAGYKIVIGDFQAAKAEAAKSVAAADKRGWNYFQAHARLLHALAYFAADELDEATVALDRLDRAMADGMSDSLALSAKLLRAELHYRRGDAAGGEMALKAALTFGRLQGARYPIMPRPIVQHLCRRALRRGIEPDFVRLMIRAGGLPSADAFDETWPWPIRIATLGGLAIAIDGAPLVFSGKVPRRLLTLVQAIAAYGGRGVPEAKIVDAVWPDEEADAAFNALNIAIHRLRKLLGDADAIVVSNGTIGFDPARCWLDVWTLDHLCGETPDAADPFVAERLVALYKGDFLADDEQAWVNAPRDQWRRRFARKLCACLAQDAAPIPLLARALNAAPTAEELARGLMQWHLDHARADEGIAAYERFRDARAAGDEPAPSPAITALYRKLLAVSIDA